MTSEQAPPAQPSAEQVKLLVEKIQQFFAHQIQNSSELSEAAKESLTVASECIGQAYGIEPKPASTELLDIFMSQRQHDRFGASLGAQLGAELGSILGGASGVTNPTQLMQNITNLLSQSGLGGIAQAATGGGGGGGGGRTASRNSTPRESSTTSPTNEPPTTAQQQPQPQQQQQQAQPRPRRHVSEADKQTAENYKNQGNDLMNQRCFQAAYDSYTKAIELDDGNAIYYSNRAAASSKQANHAAAIADCEEAIKLDPNYSKAYGRLGLAHATLGNHVKAKEAYARAVELDPQNESYRNNLRAAEEQLAAGNGNAQTGVEGGASGADPMFSMLRSMVGNPEMIQMAMRSLQNPAMQNLFGSMAANMAGMSGGQQQQQPPPGGNNNNNNSNNGNNNNPGSGGSA